MRIYLSVIVLIFPLISNLYALEYKLVKKWGGFDALYGDKEGEFHFPTDVAVDKEGFVYVVDKGNKRVQKFTKDGEFILSFGKDILNSPKKMAIDKEGNIYVIDNYNLKLFDKKGKFVKDFLSDYRIEAVACSKDYLYVAIEKSEGDNKILKIDYNTWKIIGEWRIEYVSGGNIEDLIYDERDNYLYLSYGKKIKIYDTEGNIISNRWAEKQFVSIRDIAIGVDNNNNKYLYIVSHYDEAIIWYDITGREIHRIYSPARQIGYGISFSKDGYLYLADSASHRIVKFKPYLIFVSEWKKEPEEGKFHNPHDIAIDNKGYVYVVDRGNHRVQKFTHDGRFIKMWGNKGFKDGNFYFPSSIAIDNDNNIYILDLYAPEGFNVAAELRIQKFTEEGEFISKCIARRRKETFSNQSKIKNRQNIYSDDYWEYVSPTDLDITDLDIDNKGNFYIIERIPWVSSPPNMLRVTNNGEYIDDLCMSYLWKLFCDGTKHSFGVGSIIVDRKRDLYYIYGYSNSRNYPENFTFIKVFDLKNNLVKIVKKWKTINFLNEIALNEIAIDREGNIYAANEGEEGEFLLKKYDSNGKLIFRYSCKDFNIEPLKQVGCIAVNKNGSIYIADYEGHCVYKFAPIRDVSSLLPKELTYVYPNPVKDRANFKFYVKEKSNIIINIFNIAGELITKLRKENTIGVDEITWNIPDNIASGVYLFQIKAISINTGIESIVTKKLAIIR